VTEIIRTHFGLEEKEKELVEGRVERGEMEGDC
jgi:hypothetical protein